MGNHARKVLPIKSALAGNVAATAAKLRVATMATMIGYAAHRLIYMINAINNKFSPATARIDIFPPLHRVPPLNPPLE